MKSIGARLTFWYAVSATATLFLLFMLGYKLQEAQLIGGLDTLMSAEQAQIKARLGDSRSGLTSEVLRQRVRETTDYASALFYIVIENPRTGVSFRSENLRRREIPDIKGKHAYNAMVPGVGEARVNEFLIPPIDVTIATPLRPVRESMQAYVRVGVALLAAMLLMSVGIGFGLSRILVRPIRLIRETANRIGSDNLRDRIPVGKVQDEVSDLALLLNQMFDRLETAFDQIRRFSEEASHELKTPLSLVRLHAEQMLSDGELSQKHTDAVVVQIEELARLNTIIDELLFLSRAEVRAVGLTREVQDPQKLLYGFQQDAQALVEHEGRRLRFSHAGQGVVSMEARLIRQVLLNLLSNAIKASPPDGLIIVRSDVGPEGWRVIVEDEGWGVPPSMRERIFERFVRLETGYTENRGNGLGLAICRTIIRLHQGRIFAGDAERGSGLRVTFEIPASLAVASLSRGSRFTQPESATAPDVEPERAFTSA